MTTNSPRREPYAAQTPAQQAGAPGQTSVPEPDEKDDKGTPMYVTDNPSVYGEPPKDEEAEDKK